MQPWEVLMNLSGNRILVAERGRLEDPFNGLRAAMADQPQYSPH